MYNMSRKANNGKRPLAGREMERPDTYAAPSTNPAIFTMAQEYPS